MKTISGRKILTKLEEQLEELGVEDWIKYCKNELSQIDREELADLLRDISVRLRPNSTISESKRSALEQLREMALKQDLLKDKQANLEKIRNLREKIQTAPDDIVKSIIEKLDIVEKEARKDHVGTIPMQDRIAKSAQTKKKIDELGVQFELEIKRKTLEADLADRDQARDAKRFQVFAGKESMANILGGILLILFSIVLIVSMFTETSENSLEIIKNAFMVLLGFFFGQNISTDKDNGGK